MAGTGDLPPVDDLPWTSSMLTRERGGVKPKKKEASAGIRCEY
jgi:hypothetical protein